MRKLQLLCALGLAFSMIGGRAATAQIEVQVGYSDGLRGPGFFPNPWAGDPGVQFVGSAAPYDAGAIRIINLGATPLTINDVTVTIHPVAYPGTTFDLWGSNVLLPGNSLVLTQTTQYNFDTSDYPISANGVPVSGGPNSPLVQVTVNGTPTVFTDSAHVLDTEGFDFAYNGSNESFQWRDIGTVGGPAVNTPVPNSALIMLAGGGLASFRVLRGRLRFSR